MIRLLLTIAISLMLTSINAQNVNIPDTIFKSFLLNHNPVIDINGDNEIQISEAFDFSGILDVTNFDYSNYNNVIYDLTGIEAFENITEFHAPNHSLYGKTLDFSSNPELLVLDLGYSNFDYLVISNNPELIELNISGYGNEVNVSHLIDLEVLNLRHTNFPYIDLTQNVKLRKLEIFASEITSLDLSNNINIENLSTGGAPLDGLDITNNIKIEYLEIQSAEYESIDLSQNIMLNHIACYGSKIRSFDFSNNINLEYFGCGNNIFTSLDFSQNPLLNRFVSQGNDSLEFVNLKNGNINNLSIEVLGHPLLTQICVDDVDYAISNFTNVDDSSVFNTCDSLSSEDGYNPDILFVPNNFDVDIVSFQIMTFEGVVFDITPIEINSDKITFDLSAYDFTRFYLRCVSADETFVKTIIRNHNP